MRENKMGKRDYAGKRGRQTSVHPPPPSLPPPIYPRHQETGKRREEELDADRPACHLVFQLP